MKKLLATALCAVMLCAMVIPMTVSAAGMILWSDDFSTMKEEDWVWEGSRFEVIDGHLEGDGVVHQSNYLEEEGGNKMWGDNTAFAAEMWAMEDSGRGYTSHSLGLWWADYLARDASGDSLGRIVYSVRYYFEDKKVKLSFTLEGEAEEFAEAIELADPENNIIAEYAVPESDAPAMDFDKPGHFRIGLRVKDGVLSCYFNDQLVIAATAHRGAACGKDEPSPFLLWNEGTWCCFDNVIVATADYNLFNETAVTEPVVTEPAATEPAVPDTTAIVEHVETVINEEGEVETRIVTEIVTNAPAPVTQKTPTGGNTSGGAQTGDMAVIVVAVMVVALGAAVVVKKVNQ